MTARQMVVMPADVRSASRSSRSVASGWAVMAAVSRSSCPSKTRPRNFVCVSGSIDTFHAGVLQRLDPRALRDTGREFLGRLSRLRVLITRLAQSIEIWGGNAPPGTGYQGVYEYNEKRSNESWHRSDVDAAHALACSARTDVTRRPRMPSTTETDFEITSDRPREESAARDVGDAGLVLELRKRTLSPSGPGGDDHEATRTRLPDGRRRSQAASRATRQLVATECHRMAADGQTGAG